MKISILEEHIQTRNRTIVKGSKEEFKFITDITNLIKRITLVTKKILNALYKNLHNSPLENTLLNSPKMLSFIYLLLYFFPFFYYSALVLFFLFFFILSSYCLILNVCNYLVVTTACCQAPHNKLMIQKKKLSCDVTTVTSQSYISQSQSHNNMLYRRI